MEEIELFQQMMMNKSSPIGKKKRRGVEKEKSAHLNSHLIQKIIQDRP